MLPKKVWIAWTTIAITLTACEQTKNLLHKLPKINPPTTEPQASPFPVQSPAIAEMEAQIRKQINAIRTSKGLNSLQSNDRLAQVARNYSQKMAREKFFSHTSPDGDTPARRVRSAGLVYMVVGENLFTSTNVPQPVSTAVKGWMESPGHRENILRSAYTETGVGIWRNGSTYYITQLFMRPLF